MCMFEREMDEWSSCTERHVRITLAPTEFGNHYVRYVRIPYLPL